MNRLGGLGALGALVLVVGCAAEPGGDVEAMTADEDVMEPTQLVTSNGWTADAQQPARLDLAPNVKVKGMAYFTGPTGQTRKIGVCALKQAKGSSGYPISCTTASTCPAPPAGGAKYCAAPNGVGTKTCFLRPGAASSYCAGSPANGGVPVGAGTFLTPEQPAGFGTNVWISYACFEGCAATDPSSSSAAMAVNNLQPPPGEP